MKDAWITAIIAVIALAAVLTPVLTLRYMARLERRRREESERDDHG